jgi:hypothetical protein
VISHTTTLSTRATSQILSQPEIICLFNPWCVKSRTLRVKYRADAVRHWKERRYPRHLGFGKQDQLCHGSTPLVPSVNQ